MQMNTPGASLLRVMRLHNVRLQIAHVRRVIVAPMAAQLAFTQLLVQLGAGRSLDAAQFNALPMHLGHRHEQLGGETVPMFARSHAGRVKVAGDAVQMEALHTGLRVVAELKVVGRPAGQFDAIGGE